MKNLLNPFDLENLRTQLLKEIDNNDYLHLNLFEFNKYFLTVLNQNDLNITEAFITEFIPNYKLAISKFDVWGIDKISTQKLLSDLKNIFSFNSFFQPLNFLKFEIIKIEEQLEKLNSILLGKNFQENTEINFPLIYKPCKNNFYGIIESLKVRINKSTQLDNIIIVPSEKVIEEQILSQCTKSWNLALDLSKKYLNKLNPFHEVIISFSKKIGFYEGNSFGIALTISFLEQILIFYNPTFLININEKIGFTGSVSDSGKIFNMGEEIIRQKIKVVFFSNLELFVIPKTDEIFANDELIKLKEIYPKRNLKIIPVEGISDVLNRRDLVDIKKQKLLNRSAKFIKKHSVGTTALILSLILFSYLLLIDLDDNPAILDVTMNKLFVKNKSGKILWTKSMNYNNSIIENPRNLNRMQILCDIDNDRINEIILTDNSFEDLDNPNEISRIVCFDKKKKIIWKYKFKDKIIANSGELDIYYGTNLIDTLTIKKRKVLFCSAGSLNSFSSAIFQLDLQTGERINGTLWNAGHFTQGILKDLNNDKKKDLVSVFFNNSFEQIGILAIDLNELNEDCQCPSTIKYAYKDLPLANFLNYILFPKTDYTHYINQRMEGLPGDNVIENNERKIIEIGVAIVNKYIGLSYQMSYNMKDFNIVIGNEFRVKRDSLVIKGKLKPPLTDTDEYCNILKSQIKFWNGKEFVYSKDLN